FFIHLTFTLFPYTTLFRSKYIQMKFLLSLAVACLSVMALQVQQYPKRELRAAWIATVTNIDWPSKKGLGVAEQQQEYVQLLDTLDRKSTRLNSSHVKISYA